MQKIEVLLGSLVGESDQIVASVVRQIRAEVPGYAALGYDEHFRDSSVSIRHILEGVRTGRHPGGDAVDYARTMGRNRAAIGLPLNQGIEGYHIGYREIWRELLVRAGRHEPDLTTELAGEVAYLWNWFHRLSSAFSDGYVEESRSMVAAALTLRRRFVGVLSGPPGDPGETSGLARSLGFDPDGQFVAVAASGWLDSDIDRVNGVLTKSDGAAHCVDAPSGAAVVIAQGMSAPALVDTVGEAMPAAHLGVGLVRTGVLGAAASLRDAEEALEWARTCEETTYFADHWLACSLADKRQRLEPLLGRGAEVAEAHPVLAETVRTFIDSRFSASAAGRVLHVHPNSVKYRIGRWHSLTGWDVQAPDGFIRSFLCLEALGYASAPGSAPRG